MVAIEPKNRQILSLSKSKERNTFVAERFISGVIEIHGKYPISTDGGTWYPMASNSRVKHHIHSPFEKSIMERAMRYIKGRTEGFDDYFPFRMENCKLKHIKNWLNLFIYYHNKISCVIRNTYSFPMNFVSVLLMLVLYSVVYQTCYYV